MSDYNIADLRVGQGYDIHRLVTGRDLILGGIKIPHHLGLDGHSDADCLIHSIIDAIMGACALGDIGTHFSDQDDQYKSIDSRILLQRTRQLAKDNHYVLINIDSTIIAQKPKLVPFVPQMIKNIAEDLGLDISQVNVKCKTNEKCDATGQQEAIVCQASCLLYKNHP